jgi:hypothetical protein
MLHPIRESVHELGRLYAFEVRLLASSYFSPVHEPDRKIAQFVKWARVIWPVHEMGNFTDGV